MRSIAHNIADSVGSGIGLLIGYYEMDIFGEASRSPEGAITVDFLAGKAISGVVSPSLANALTHYQGAFADLCARQGVSPAEFSECTARFSRDSVGRSIVVAVEDQHGRRRVDQYIGIPARRIRILDRLGRVRRV